jgi:hypothetical protein
MSHLTGDPSRKCCVTNVYPREHLATNHRGGPPTTGAPPGRNVPPELTPTESPLKWTMTHPITKLHNNWTTKWVPLTLTTKLCWT